MAHVQTNAFPPSTKVYLYPSGAARPESGLKSGTSLSVTKDGTVAFEAKGSNPGEFVWLAGELEDGSWLAIACSVKDGPKKDAVDPAVALAETVPFEAPQEPPRHTPESRTRSTDRPKAKPRKKAKRVTKKAKAEKADPGSERSKAPKSAAEKSAEINPAQSAAKKR